MRDKMQRCASRQGSLDTWTVRAFAIISII
jgi:hypothetical protein